jgi:hypothetical protein
MKLVLSFLFIIFSSSFVSAEVVLRDGFIPPNGLKTGVKVTCSNENMERSLQNWYADYSESVAKNSTINDLRVTHTTSSSGLVNIRLEGFTFNVEYALQPAAGCGVSSYVESI